MGAGSRTATPAYALYGGIHNKRDWICNPATRNAWHSASNDNLAADDATSGNGTSPNCSIPGKWHRRPLCRKYRTDCRMRGMDAPFGKTNIVPRPDSEKLVKLKRRIARAETCSVGTFVAHFRHIVWRCTFKDMHGILTVGHGLPQLDTTKPRTVHSDSRPFICIYKCGNSARINSNKYSSWVFAISKIATLINFSKFYPIYFRIPLKNM